MFFVCLFLLLLLFIGTESSVCWFAVHILHCRLLIKKRTEQISVLLYEWTREKQYRSFDVAADHVISLSTELRDQKFSVSIVSTIAETTELITLLKQLMEQQSQQHREVTQTLLKLLDVQKYGTDEDDSSTHHPQLSTAAIPPFAAFDSTSEQWPNYWLRFCTFVVANAVPEQRKAQVFLTSQTAAVYKQLANLAAQQTPSNDNNELTTLEIVDFMKEQFDPKLCIVCECFKFWSDMQRKPDETLQELAARIRQDAATCDFPSIKDS